MTNRTLHKPKSPFLGAAIRLAALWVFYIVVFEVLRAVFIAVHSKVMDSGFGDAVAAMWHGLAMDACTAAYLAAVPGLLLALSMTVRGRWLRIVMKAYLAVAAVVVAVVIVTDMVLYGYWGFRLDATPVFYFMSSPALALASAPFWQIIVGVVAIAALAYAVWLGSSRIAAWQPEELPRRRAASTAGMVLVTALLFIPIRGGFTVSTMNLSRAYFSTNQRLNHAAINPAFSLLYSLTHSSDYASQYRFYPDDEARRLASRLEVPAPEGADSLRLQWLSDPRPDIYLIILESFSSHLLPSTGGEPVALRLDSLARSGLLFSGIYASGFRTDRALPAILNAMPTQPSASLLKYVDKIERLPALASVLSWFGDYDCSYYYGGDVNFTNMKALLVSSGYQNIVADTDFPLALRASKWGVHDGPVFDRALADAATPSQRPRFVTIQTSSSHEPFEVPAQFARYSDSRCNAFAYADSCLGAFVDGVMALERPRPALFVIVPDHYGAYPENIADMAERHHIPLVFCGDAVAVADTVIATPGTQPDITATILGAMGIEAEPFVYSHDLALPRPAAYSYFCEPGAIGMLTATDTVYVNVDADAVTYASGTAPDSLAASAKAWLQILYTRISEL